MARGVGSVGLAGPGGKLLLGALLRSSPWVMLWSLLGAAVGSAGFGAVHQLAAAVTLASERLLADGALPSLSVTRSGGVEAWQPVRMQQFRGVRAALARQSGPVHLRGADGREHAATLFGVQLAQEMMARPQRMCLQTRLPYAHPGPERQGDLFVTRTTAAELGLEPGMTVAIRGSGGTRQLALRGVLADPAGAVLGPALAVVGLSTSAELLGRSDLDQVEVILAGDQEPEAAAPALRALLGPEFTVAPLPARTAGNAGAAAVRVCVELAAWLALGLGALALLAAAGDRVRAMAPDLALQRAIGVGPALLLLQVLLPSVLAGAVAGAIGALLGPLLAGAFLPGLQAWLQAQTGTGVWLELPPARELLILGPAAGAAAGLCAALWAGRAAARAETGPGIRAPEGSASRGALTGTRAAAGAVCLLGVWLIAWSGATRLGFPMRALDAALAVLGIALLAGPAAALLAKACAGISPITLLAAGRIRRTPGRLLSASRLLAVALAVALALLGVRTSVSSAAPALAEARCGADLVVVRAGGLIGMPSLPVDAVAAAAALAGTEGLAQPWVPGAQAELRLQLLPGADAATVASTVATRLAPLGDVAVLDGAFLRRRFLAAVQLVLDAVGMLVLLLLAVAVPAAVAFLFADAAQRHRETALLQAAGASPLQRAGVAAAAATLFVGAAAAVAAGGGTLIGACWTAGPLQHALGVRCAYVLPAAATLVLCVPLCLTLSALALRLCRRATRLTAW